MKKRNTDVGLSSTIETADDGPGDALNIFKQHLWMAKGGTKRTLKK